MDAQQNQLVPAPRGSRGLNEMPKLPDYAETIATLNELIARMKRPQRG